MSLVAGNRIGPYEIVGPLGAGGMGEVYRARDAKLNRSVAIKILPEAFADDAERLARFNREAKALAALNHPNIAAIYGMEGNALVMELVEGEDLSVIIARQGATPSGGGAPRGIHIEDALPIAKQIVDALEAAHEQGIIHRDLKPANIKVRTDGTVKILDFGLAKAMDPAGTPSIDAMNSPTLTAAGFAQGYGGPGTQMGMILGTAAYMAPEQAKGRAVDKRADIWAFGAVLFEMLSGTRAFGGEDVSETLASVLKDQPAISSLPASVPASVRQLLHRCLQKDPRQRLRDIGDARLLLDEAPEVVPPAATVHPVASNRAAALVPWVIAATAVVGAVFLAPRWRQPAAPAPSSVRFVIPEPNGSQAFELSLTGPVVSSDGTFIVFDTDRIFLRRTSEFEAHELPGTTGADMPFVSPDDRWVGYFADGKIKRVSVSGGEPQDITTASSDSPGASFISNDRILFTTGWSKNALQSVAADGGPVTPASTLDTASGEIGHWWPHALPDGRHVLFTIWYAATGLSASKIAVLDLDTGKHRVLFPGAMPSYAAGQLLYYRAGQYHLAPFDPATATITGESKPVLPEAFGLDPTGDNQKPVSLSAAGAVAYWPGELNPIEMMTWIDRNGARTPTSISVRVDGAALSPDGRRLAVGRPDGGASQVWVYDFAGGEQRLAGEGSNWAPVWNPDGIRLAYTSLRKGNYDAAIQSPDGPQEFVLDADNDEAPIGWLADGRLLVNEWLPSGPKQLQLISADRKTRELLVTGVFNHRGARVSPDGRWVALCASPSGSFSLYVRSLTQNGGLDRLAAGGADGCDVQWSPTAKELVFTRGTTLVSVTYEERGGHLAAVGEKPITTMPPHSTLYGITPDGLRFLVGIPAPKTLTAPPGIRVILDGIASLGAGK